MTKVVQVYGYHGRNMDAAINIIEKGFNISANDYDWLGTGVYFFQDAPVRAWQWAKNRYPNSPALICSLIRLENCIDLLDVSWFPIIRESYSLFVNEYRKTDQSLPLQNPQRSKAHRLDCTYFNYIVDRILVPQGEKIDAIRAVFLEGERIFPNSAIFDLAHVQIAIRNLSIIESSSIIESRSNL